MNRIKNQLQQFQEIGIWYSLACLSSWATAISISIFIISGVGLIAFPLTGNKTPQTLKKGKLWKLWICNWAYFIWDRSSIPRG